MQEIRRHTIDMDIVNSNILSEADFVMRKLTVISKRPSLLEPLLVSARDYLSYLSVVDRESAEMCQAVQIGVETALAVVQVAKPTGEQVEVKIGDVPSFVLGTKGPNGFSTLRNWYVGFYFAVIRRDRAALDLLARVPIEQLRSPNSTADECQYLYIDTLQGLWKREKDTAERLYATVQATDPQLLTVAPTYILNILVPETRLFFAFLQLDAAGFNAALAKAVQAHKDYWSVKSRRDNPASYVALGPTAFASLAYDINIPIEVESEYLPMRLVRGDCRI